ncbi:MAG: carbohydrate binding family 9 domain-containing protein [Gemmatimonadaceae bacterium]|nr:carbohydrate binding family 9 domain-containing protein [Gemmatimonadaceae bacterium]
MKFASILLACALGAPGLISSQARPDRPTPNDSLLALKRANAVRVRPGAISVDGKLSESAWDTIPALTDFVQKDPVERAVPSDKMEVRFAYDDAALYVAIKVIVKPGRTIQSPIGRRDNISQSEYVGVSFDSYRDRRTAYSFVVTASGVRGDFYHPNDDEGSDASFDPVWEAAANQTAEGWTAEMRIPFSQLRFNARENQLWGLNIRHWVPSLNENVYWNPVPKRGSGWSSWMGSLERISGIAPSRRLELMPYVATEAKFTGNRVTSNPFDDGKNLGARIGGDLKMGLGPALTLQATINPDFGQVEADPAEVNLSAFETFFSEKRPFFVEGSNLFQGGHSYFYSRRIGGRPRGPASGSFVDYPNASTILGAAKLTGRLPGGASIAGLTAVTNRESAQTYDTVAKTFGRTVVAPLTTYAVGRVQQELGKSHSTVGFMLTGITRNLEDGSPLERILNKSAFSGGADWSIRLKEGEYVVGGALGFSNIRGDSTAIILAQRSSARYFQRPDARHYHVDSTRTSLTGFNASSRIEKRTGKHWLGGVYVSAESPSFEINDVGRIGTADGVAHGGSITYRETQPNRFLRRYSVRGSYDAEINFDRDRQYGEMGTTFDATFPNFWNIQMDAYHDVRAQDERLTRGGPSMGYGYNSYGIINLSNNNASKTRWNARVYYGKDEFGSPTNRLSGSYSIRPSSQWQFSLVPNYLRSVNSRQFVTSRAGGSSATYGRRYVFSFLDASQLVAETRLSYTFTPNLTLEFYGQPFAASGRYYDFGELDAPRSRNLRHYGKDGTSIQQLSDGSYRVVDTKITSGGAPSTITIGNPDFNVRSFRSNTVLRWEYRPGSTFFVVWQQDRSRSEAQGRLIGINDVLGAFSQPGNNFIAIKANFWIPVR